MPLKIKVRLFLNFVVTARNVIAKLSIRKPGSSSVLIISDAISQRVKVRLLAAICRARFTLWRMPSSEHA